MMSGAMPDAEVEEFALAYLRFASALMTMPPDSDGRLSDEAECDEAAYSFVQRVIRHGPGPAAWLLVRAILRYASDDDLAHHAAGPLEDLVRRHATAVVDLVEREAAIDPRFRWALGQIWTERSAIPSEVLERIVHASENQIRPV
jgi:hypothetical protein